MGDRSSFDLLEVWSTLSEKINDGCCGIDSFFDTYHSCINELIGKVDMDVRIPSFDESKYFSNRDEGSPEFLASDEISVNFTFEEEHFAHVSFSRQNGFGIFSDSEVALVKSVTPIASVLLKKSLKFCYVERENARLKAVSEIIKYRSMNLSLEQLLRSTVGIIDKLLNPELASIYLCDQLKREIFVCASKDGMEGLTIGYNQGVAGHVAATGLSMRVADAYKDEHFLSLVDKMTGQRTKSMICVPVPGSTVIPIAIIQVINKKSGSNFSTYDMDSLSLLAKELYLGIRSQAREFYDLKSFRSSSSPDANVMEASLLQVYGSTVPKYRYRVIGEKIVRLDSVNICAMRSASGSSLVFPSSEITPRNILCSSIEEEQNIAEDVLKFDIDPFAVSDQYLLSLSIQMLLYFDLFEALQVRMRCFQHFLEVVRSLYHSDNPFHNFKHAWSVMHAVFHFVRLGGEQYLVRPIEIYSILIAALCHDLDHPGHSNAFEIASDSELSLVYAGDSVLERHHIAATLRLLRREDIKITEGFGKADMCYMKSIIVASIMTTDMCHHFGLVEQIISRASSKCPFDSNDVESKKRLCQFIVHAADISSQGLKLDLALKWTDNLCAEFDRQTKKEEELGLTITSFMTGLNSEVNKCRLQVGFIGDLLLPLWTAFSEIFPETRFFLDRLKYNHAYYANRMDELKTMKSDLPRK